MKKSLFALAVTVTLAATVHAGGNQDDHDRNSNHFQFKSDTLVLSRSVYAGNADTVTVGQTLPPGGEVFFP